MAEAVRGAGGSWPRRGGRDWAGAAAAWRGAGWEVGGIGRGAAAAWRGAGCRWRLAEAGAMAGDWQAGLDAPGLLVRLRLVLGRNSHALVLLGPLWSHGHHAYQSVGSTAGKWPGPPILLPVCA